MVLLPSSTTSKPSTTPTPVSTKLSTSTNPSLLATTSPSVTCKSFSLFYVENYIFPLPRERISIPLFLQLSSIQFAGALGVSNCPGAPRLPVFLGRPNGMFHPTIKRARHFFLQFLLSSHRPCPRRHCPRALRCVLSSTDTSSSIRDITDYHTHYPETDSVDKILDRFTDAGGFSTVEVVWLLSSYVFSITLHHHHRNPS